MESAPFHSEACKNRVQAAAQNVALTERLSTSGAEDISAIAATDEVRKQL
jgi:hypothetical protein